MVLLVDDQAMVCEAVRRALANQTDIDFHYCADAREALHDRQPDQAHGDPAGPGDAGH